MKKLMIVALGCVVAAGAFAEEKPFQASLTPDVAIYSKDARINGVALSIWGENPQSAFAFGFVNGSSGDSKGFSFGLVNYSDNYSGVQWGIVNNSNGKFVGWQWGIVNIAEDMTGLQWGPCQNYAGKMSGLQLGWVNYAKTMDSGVQIGLVNIIPENEWFTGFPEELAKGMVIVNWRFK